MRLTKLRSSLGTVIQLQTQSILRLSIPLLIRAAGIMLLSLLQIWAAVTYRQIYMSMVCLKAAIPVTKLIDRNGIPI